MQARSCFSENQSDVDQDELYMKIALDLAAKGKGRVEPNPMVGSLVVLEGEIVGKGYHRAFGAAHAEAAALEEAGPRARGADLYVTLEPCCHWGKTPPCSDAVIASGIVRVVAAMEDPDRRCSGKGFGKLESAGIILKKGVLESEARELNAPYVKLRTFGVPFVTAKWAMTMDGKISTGPGESSVISCRKSRELVHAIRGGSDGILVGVGTVLADDPQLTCRVEGGRSPLRIVLDSGARTPADSVVVATAKSTPTLLAVSPQAPRAKVEDLAARGVRILEIPPGDGGLDIGALLGKLGDMQMTNLLVEGGSRVFSSFFAAGLVDRVVVFVAPRIFGGEAAPTAVGGKPLPNLGAGCKFRNVAAKPVGDDILIEARICPAEEG